jgi:biotin carboxyl carrier protein
MMEKNKTAKKIVIALETIIVVGAFVFGPSLLASGDESKGMIENNETPIFSVRTENAEKRTLRAFLEVNGDIVSGQEADVFPDASGKLIRLYVALGSRVRKGDVIAEVDPSRPGTSYMSSPIHTPITGIISRTPLSVGQQSVRAQISLRCPRSTILKSLPAYRNGRSGN